VSTQNGVVIQIEIWCRKTALLSQGSGIAKRDPTSGKGEWFQSHQPAW
jgi:hypothetical protein